MKHRIVWPIVGVLGLLALLIAFNTTSAQPKPGMTWVPPGIAPPSGRFTVAYHSEKTIVVLDTATGKLYKATDKDFLPLSKLPKLEGGMVPMPAVPPLLDPKKDEKKEPELKKLEDKKQ